MSRKKELSMQELLRASKMNITDGMSLSAISRVLKVNQITLKKRMQENNVKFNMQRRRPKGSSKKKVSKLTSKEFDKGVTFITKVTATRREFVEGMIVQIKPKSNKGSLYEMKGKYTIKSLYKHFMLIEKEVDNGILKESINFRDIVTKDMHVKVC